MGRLSKKKTLPPPPHSSHDNRRRGRGRPRKKRRTAEKRSKYAIIKKKMRQERRWKRGLERAGKFHRVALCLAVKAASDRRAGRVIRESGRCRRRWQRRAWGKGGRCACACVGTVRPASRCWQERSRACLWRRTRGRRIEATLQPAMQALPGGNPGLGRAFPSR